MEKKIIKNLDLTVRDDDCRVDDDSTPEEISECIARTRREMDETLNVVEKKMDPHRIYDESVGYLRQNYQNEWQLVSDIPRRINENPEPFIIIGAGMVIGGLGLAGFALSKQRKNSPRHSGGKSFVEKGKEKLREIRSHAPQKSHSTYLKPDPETFAAVPTSQASTEELYQSDEFGEGEISQSEKKFKKSSHGQKDDSQVIMNREVDIRLGEEQFKKAKDYDKS
jgi:microcystin-dependent protein